jgi:hypothetical protein
VRFSRTASVGASLTPIAALTLESSLCSGVSARATTHRPSTVIHATTPELRAFSFARTATPATTIPVIVVLAIGAAPTKLRRTKHV